MVVNLLFLHVRCVETENITESLKSDYTGVFGVEKFLPLLQRVKSDKRIYVGLV